MEMKRSIKFATPILILAMVALSGSAWARGKGRGRERTFPGPRMVKELKLTDDQVAKIKAIHAKNQKSIEADRTARQKNREARRELQKAMQSDASKDELWKKFQAIQPDCKQRQAMQKKHFEEILEIRDVLTPEQRTQFRGMMGKSHRNRGMKRGSRRGMRRGGSGFDGGPPPPPEDE